MLGVARDVAGLHRRRWLVAQGLLDRAGDQGWVTDAEGRNVIDMWADQRSRSRVQSSALSVIAVIVVGHLVYGAVFAPHLITKLGGYVTAGPTEPLYPGVPNQPN